MAAIKMENEDKLKRLIYLCNIEPKYYCGGPDKYVKVSKSKWDLLIEMLRDNHEELLKIILAASEDKLVPYRSYILKILAYAIKMETATKEIKPQICSTALNICKSDKEFFDFIKYATSFNRSKISKTVRKTVQNFYKNKTAFELAQSYANSRSFHGWSHKDLIKLAHIKAENPVKNMVINYILFQKLNEKSNDEETAIIDVMQKAETLRKTRDHKVAVPIIKELKATIEHVEPSLRKSAEVWNSVLPNMSLSEILQVLPKLYKLGFLKKDAPTQTIVNESLTNVAKVKDSGIHPIEVFIHMKNFEKGGKPLDPKLLQHLTVEKKLTDDELQKVKTRNEAKCPIVLNNLQKCMNISCSNVQGIGKRYFVTIDTTDKMDTPCLSNKNITGVEAAAAFAWYLLKVEKDVTVAVFKEKEISVVQLDKKGHLYEHVQKLRENKNKYLLLSAPIEWATSHKKHVDIFMNFVHHKEYYTTIPKDVREKMTKPADALQKYKKKVNLQNTRLINFCLSSPHIEAADGSANILDIAGLDCAVPRVVESFCHNRFC
ncbi:unnamed protein product [Phaedon cochleariae]|uniref:RNA-binding protein RO60 vWA domain-containing protein n=1 Tax=Phaedon cochleariae TaxID=80249 RepID=A0A9N9X4U2_PHACE|nr:unnamed protein product [Phaedon cochleariae]